MKASPTILIALAGLGDGEEPSEEVLRGCEEFLSFLSMWSPHWGSKDAQVLIVQATQR